MPLDSKRVLKPLKKLRRSLNKFPKQPSPEQVHDLRTGTRKIEATLDALALNSSRKQRRLLRKIARVRKPAGKVRDMDVLIGFSSGLDVDHERTCQVELLEHLGAQRHRLARKLVTAVKDNRPSLKKRLRRCSTKVKKLVRNADKGEAQLPTPSARGAALALQLSQDLRQPAHLGRNNLHPYRLKVKELRYVLQLAEDAVNQPLIDQLGKVKDAIGEWHDWEELTALASQILEHGRNCNLIQQMKRISNAKYEQALKISKHMRSEYLGSISEQRRRSRAAQRPTQPVMVATAALAA